MAAVICAVGWCGIPVAASPDTSSSLSSDPSSSVSPPSDDSVPEDIVSSNPQETLGTAGFSDANTKRIAVGKSTTLYLTVKDMGYRFSTTFASSDKSIATVTQVDNRAVKVVGLKSGVVTITATVEANNKETKVAKYTLVVGDGELTSDSAASEPVSDGGAGIVTGYENDNDLDLFSSTDDPMLIAYAKSRTNANASSLLIGLIAWIFIISAVVYIFSVIISLRTPKLNVSPGSRRRYSTGGSDSLRSRNRLLPDKYYRGLKKY
ncbi:MAG: Ig-like domain-containing protein [Clostridia bacterium]|nr:Ig-like domain-containing protein [Clostridia bacterium]